VDRGSVPGRGLSWKFAGISLAGGLAAFLAGTTVESAVIRAVHGDRPRLEWISDVIVSAGVVALSYLWLHLRESQTRLLALEREQVAMDEQLRLAAEIQRNLLPGAPPRVEGLGWAARMVPAGRIGGDFYDYVQGSDGAVLCIVADVSGKGIPAALILSALKVLFRSIASRTREPAAIAERLAAALHDGYSGMPYATAFVARFDGVRRRMTYVNAGHPPGYVLRASEVIALESAGLPLGLLPEATYADTALDLEPGDVVAIMTDGVTEALETGGVTLAQALEAVRDRVAGDGSPSAACDALLRAAGEGGGPAGVEGWQDDRTVVVAVVDPQVRGV
jgi:phosphoserine phosphatase RsbU/P